MSSIRLQMHSALLALVTGGFMAQSAAADVSDAGTRSTLAHGVGVRALALGGAYVSLADDADAVTWNPAWLTQLRRHSFAATYVDLPEGTELHSASWGGYFDGIGGIGVAFSRLGADDFPAVINWVPQPGAISYSTSITTAALAVSVTDELSVGASGRALYESLFGLNDFSFGLNAAAAYRRGHFRAGVLIRDLVSNELDLGAAGENEPLAAQLGVSLSELRISELLKATAAFDVELIENRDPIVHSGVEGVLGDVVSLRLGLSRDDITFGAGFTINRLKIDYAYRTLDNLSDSHRFGLSLSFGKSVSQRRADAREKHESLGRSYAASERQGRASESYQRAQSYESAGELDSALLAYEVTVAIDSVYLDAQIRLSALQSQIAQRNEELASRGLAERGLDSLALSELAARLTLTLAGGLAEQSRYRAALKIIETARENSPEDSTLKDALDNILAQQLEWKTGQSRSARAAERSGDYRQALGLYADLLREFPSDQASKTALSAIGSRLRVSDLLSEARQDFDSGAYAEARSTIESALLIEPDNSVAVDLLAQIKLAQSSPSDLDALWDNQEDAQAMLRALDLVRSDRLSEALAVFERLLEKYPDNQELLKNKRQVELRLSGGQ